ncbi:hypothetical protein ACM44_08025 [Chryseobacterium koreense CCUG 49689]|uniref:Signal peptidase n=2 Tax=Chryseobacterium koreense TaxID=232216 RepID=A0A0J7LPZ4_9FLAO|nr:hypothetical protein ACM44_08025 [Chryseobacterium koreense CCUG 49689]
MKRMLLLICLVFGLSAFAQLDADNPFKQSENGSTGVAGKAGTGNENEYTGPETANNEGNPGGPQPIDDYVPLLVLAGVGIIAYVSYNKRLKATHLK